jgi:translation initiation factor 2A
MPAKATLFNAKCEAIYDFGTGSRNECYFNKHGNLVCLAGFGNIRGRVEIWHVSSSSKVPQEICSFQADDTTFFEWSPDGEHILTATTAPRLRVSNGYKYVLYMKLILRFSLNYFFKISFKIWNCYGEMKFSYQMESKNELWQANWQPGVYPIRLVNKKVAQAVPKEESKLR